MRRITVLRLEADSGIARRVAGKLPGVELVEPTEEQSAEPEPPVDSEPPTDEDSDGLVGGVTSDPGLTETVTPASDPLDEEEPSALKQYGLLGAGVALVLAGLASVGAWVYQRRGGDDEAETPPPATEFEPEMTGGETPTPSTLADETESVSTTTAPPAEEPSEPPVEEASEPAGRVEGDRSEVEWTTRDRDDTSETFEPDTVTELGRGTREDADTDTDVDTDADEPETRPGESLDPAPLLGVAFIAVSGALVRWLRGTDEEA